LAFEIRKISKKNKKIIYLFQKHSKNKNQQDRNEKANSGCSSTTDRSSLDEEHDSGLGPEELEKRNSDSSASSSSGEILPALPYEIKLSEVMGRYLVAARNLQAGEIVMEELPLAIGPCADSDAVCLGCYGELPSRSKQFKLVIIFFFFIKLFFLMAVSILFFYQTGVLDVAGRYVDQNVKV